MIISQISVSSASRLLGATGLRFALHGSQRSLLLIHFRTVPYIGRYLWLH
ncbi:hypothetical protein [Thiolapillus sp.]|nr:hypothetical protein [Thiolapillus sp.]